MLVRRGIVGVLLAGVVGVAGAGVAAPPTSVGPVPLGSDRPLDPGDARPRAETTVAVDPRDPRHVVVVGIQFERPYRDALIDERGYGADDHVWVSRDGGATYRASGGLPFLEEAWPSSNDPWVAFGPRGTVYASYTSFGRDINAPGSGLYLARSDDGGVHWRRMAHIEGFDCSGPDRSTVTVDPKRGWVYVTWTHYIEDAACSGTPDLTKTVLRWARSTDGGAHFGRPVDIATNGAGLNPSSVVLRDGTLLVVHETLAANEPGNPTCHGFTSQVVADRFSPEGRRLGSSDALTDVCDTYGGVMPNGAVYIPIIDAVPAVDPVTGRVVVAIPSIGPAANGVLVGRSSDGGRSWEQRLVVGELPGSSATMPAIAFGSRGRVALAWLEVDAGGLYRPVLASSNDWGSTWSAAVALATVPSVGNLHPVRFFDGYGIGHYIGVGVGSDDVAHVTWPDLRPDATPQDVDVWTRDVRL